MSEETQVKTAKGKDGCLMRGCLLALIVFFMMLGFAGWGAYTVYKHFYALTVDSGTPIPAYAGSDYSEVKKRVEDFSASLQEGKGERLVLTADNLNALVAGDPQFAAARGRIYFEIKNNLITAQVSIPLDGVRGFAGRWFNGTMTFDLKLEEQQLSIVPRAIKTGDREAPPEVLLAVQRFRWSDSLYEEGQSSEILKRIKSIRIENNTLVME
jgi:hypothetical protein